MHVSTSPYTFPLTSSNQAQAMQPPISSNTTGAMNPSADQRARLYSLINGLADEQLRLFLTNHLQSISNTTFNINQFQHYSRTQLLQQSFILVDNYFSPDLEKALYAMRQKTSSNDHRQQQQQQQQVYRAQQQNYAAPYNPTPYYYNQQSVQYNIQPNYHFSTAQAVPQPLRQIRPNASSVSSSNTRPSHPPRPQQTTNYYAPAAPRQQYIRHASPPVAPTNAAPALAPSSSNGLRYQAPILPPPPSTPTRPPLPPASSPPSITHKTLPFYRPLMCVLECYQVFRYDSYRKQYSFRHDFLLSLDVCNQLALSFDYDADLDIHKTSKCLILRLARIDQPPMANGKYDDNLPPNLIMQINSQNVTHLPVPKPCTRQQSDLVRIGREIDITSYCMFNPMLSNELSITWYYRPENAELHSKYATAQYALHVFLVQHMNVDELCEHIKMKPARSYREDLVKLVAKARATDRDLGLEVSDQILKLKCPIDQRRLRTPIRAVTCQHLQCFDLSNYIALNEKSGKWICPVCNKPALFDDLQIDSYTESILNSIRNENITEITIDGDLHWKPVTSQALVTEQRQARQVAAHTDDIVLDDDDETYTYREPIDSKANIPLISSSADERTDLILIDED